ncbi:hypothetical protein MUG87_02905 [Ectobacillus sp. JY-23]|uniref:hypothetical protein n=1 Tax=Ectobacillus sp. JY-23 TaxID=2933872 RepID=UPI001FF10BE2|nr:hypothetical protein [Ectobacillus sp. JY-23]UOY93101.1 hypothetical protein MUG87_02905 [Ectobacillus sp. JY-23]
MSIIFLCVCGFLFLSSVFVLYIQRNNMPAPYYKSDHEQMIACMRSVTRKQYWQ